MNLREYFNIHNKIAVAYSGGVDSSFLFYSACKYASRVKAYYVKSCLQSENDYLQALIFANKINAELEIIEFDALGNQNIRKNSPERCYYCKKEMFTLICEKALNDGFSFICDGTNASDSTDDRPGMKALFEMSIHSPLRECSLTKEEIRMLSKEAGLDFWNKPSNSCLATRIPFNTPLDITALRNADEAESFLHSLGIADLRVRKVGEYAEVEIRSDDKDVVERNRELIKQKLSHCYKDVIFD